MTIGELMNALIQAVDCDSVDTDTEITFYIPNISEYMSNFKSAKIEVKIIGTNHCVLTLK